MTDDAIAPDAAGPGPDATDASAEPGTIHLPERLEMRTIAKVIAAIQAAPDAVTFNADRVDLITSPGVQVLLSAARSGRDVTVVDPSAAFLDCIALLGVGPDQINIEGARA